MQHSIADLCTGRPPRVADRIRHQLNGSEIAIIASPDEYTCDSTYLVQCSRVKFLGASEQFARRQRNAIR